MKLPLRLPVLPSQCYSSPVTDDTLDSPHGTTTGSRQPLKESTGNAQQHSQFGAMVRSSSYDQRPESVYSTIHSPSVFPGSQSLDESTGNSHHGHFGAMVRSNSYDQWAESVYSIPPSIPTPPVFPGQGLDFGYGASQYSRLHQRHQVHSQGGGRRGLGKNPFWSSPQFQAYRKRQAERDEKGSQKWPDWLEEAFLDAFLIIPQIKKMKYSLRGELFGRNMLIGEYLWLHYLATLSPGVAPDHLQRRGRKQVSSHIQVVKGFLKEHPYFNIFFPMYFGRKKSDGEICEKESFKNHPVLVALTEGRLPDERPNYDYFAQILAMKDQVAIKPKRCWIFVSHRDVAVQEDGSGLFVTTADRLHRGEYPHLKLNLEREKWAKEEQQIFKGALLHEFTKDLSQFESTTVRELSDEWEDTCPELHQKLKDIIDTDPRCDILHMHSILELKEKRRFPGHSDLNSWVEINIEQPHLLNHRWKVETTLVRPPELSYSSDKGAPETVYKTSSKIAIQYQHRPGCEGHRNGGEPCDGVSRCRRDCVIVPFPADVWALTLTNCAEYPAHPSNESLRSGNRIREIKSTKDNDGEEDSNTSGSGEQPTQMDLVKKISMLQELWSCAPDDSSVYGEDGHGGEPKSAPRWERRGLILWTFRTIHSVVVEKKNPPEIKTAPNGKTQWRFLTLLDPCSQYHQQRVLVRGSDSTSRYRDGVGRVNNFGSSVKFDSIPPSPTGYPQQQRTSSLSDSYPTSWDVHGGGLTSLSTSAAQAQAQAQAAYNAQLMVQTGHTGGLLDSFGGESGLATSPSSASLASSFATSFESVANDADPLAGYMAAHVTTADMGTHSQALSDLSAVTDPFLTSTGVSSFDPGAYDDGSYDSVSGWDSGSTVPGVRDANGWPTGYSGANTNHPGGLLHWVQSSPSAGSRVAAVGSSDIKHYNQQQQHHHQQQSHHHHHPHHHHQQQQQRQQHHWVADTNPEETGFWTPAASTEDPVSAVTLDGREQVIWTGPAAVEDDQSHTHPHSESGAEDWVQIQTSCAPAPSLPSASAISAISAEDDVHSSNNSDLSQGWEEIVAATTSTSASTTASSSDTPSQQQQDYHHLSQNTVAIVDDDHVADDDDDLVASFPLNPLGGHPPGNTQTQQQQQQYEPRGQKRGRSDSNRMEMDRMERDRQRRMVSEVGREMMRLQRMG